MIYPVELALGISAAVTCKVNAMGGTVVSATYGKSKFADVTFDDYSVDTQGYDGLALRIAGALASQVEDALGSVE